MMHYSDDPHKDFLRHEADLEEGLKDCPVCDCCGEYIFEDYYFEDDGDKFCDNCWDDHVRDCFLKFVR